MIWTFEKPEREGYGFIKFGPYETEDEAANAYQRKFGTWPQFGALIVEEYHNV